MPARPRRRECNGQLGLCTPRLGPYNRAMIRPGSPRYRALVTLAALAMALRVMVPVGFMPSSTANGWYLELCPDGLPAHVMVALFGEHHAHHGGDDSSFYQCDYGGGTLGAALLDTGAPFTTPHVSADPVAVVETSLPAGTRVFGFRSRAPPSVVRYLPDNT